MVGTPPYAFASGDFAHPTMSAISSACSARFNRVCYSPF